MPILTILVVIVVGCLLFWVIDALHTPAPFNTILKVALVLIFCLWLLSLVGVVDFGGARLR